MEKGTVLKLTKFLEKFCLIILEDAQNYYKKMKFKDEKELEKQVIMYLLPVTVILTSKSQ